MGGNINTKHAVSVEASSLYLDRLVLSWGIFRSDASSFMPVETPFVRGSVGSFTLELEFEAKQAPFYLSFLLRSPAEADSSSSIDIMSHRKTRFCVPIGFGSGHPAPLGLSTLKDGSLNFALFSRNAGRVVLCLYGKDPADHEPALELELDPYVNRTGDVWHASMDQAIPFVSYGYRCKGPIQLEGEGEHESKHAVLDPYAKKLEKSAFSSLLGRITKEPDFDWSGDVRLCLPMEKMVVYRLNVMRFTQDKSSKLPRGVEGSFSGVAEKVQHFKGLGVNAVLLEPICPFDAQKGPYFPSHFFSPTYLYGPSGSLLSTAASLKEMVKWLHVNGVEVLLEVVFSHTGDGVALQKIDHPSYHRVHGDANANGGNRNALNCNHPIVQQLILDSLRCWVTEFHVDGFCFVNSSALLRGLRGERLSRPPLVEAIAFDPILSNRKIIADNWDPQDLAPDDVVRFPHWKRWAEMNSKFCDDVRNYLRGEGLLSDLATRLCGSGDVFSGGRGPAFSFNFVARNSGLSLVDLVSYSNSSELASHLSWNCGEEGPTNKIAVLETRLKQIRNYLFILFVSQGVPVLNMGDECGLSSGGSPQYVHKSPFNWSSLSAGFGVQITQFISFLSSLRVQRADIFQRGEFLKVENIDWHGAEQCAPRWDDPASKFLAMTLRVESQASTRGDLCIAFNATDSPKSVFLSPPPAGMLWVRLVDTALPFPDFFLKEGDPPPVLEQVAAALPAYELRSHSCALFEARIPGG